VAKEEINRRIIFEQSEKAIWLDSYYDLGEGNFDLVFKSAKFNQSRPVRNVPTMENLGILMEPEYGAEETNHFCIRYRKDSYRFFVVCEFNYHGITISGIREYLNAQFEQLNEVTETPYFYAVSFDVLPSKDFLEALDDMHKRSVLRLTVDILDIAQGDFQRFSGRNELRQEVEIYIRKDKGRKNNIPADLIKELYENTGKTKKIRKMAVEGTNNSGNLKIDTESIQMRHSIWVDALAKTREVVTSDFFEKAGAFIKEMGV
jgi:hypothetical protein